MSRIKNIFFATLFCFCMSLESMNRMERPKKSLQEDCTRKRLHLNHTLKVARKNHDFRVVAQLPPTTNEHEIQKLKKTNLTIQYYFIKKINQAKTITKLQELYVEIINKIDFIENTREYELLAYKIYDKHLALSKN